MKAGTVELLIDEYNRKLTKVASEGFKIENGKIALKKLHNNYYQIQHQLLITGLQFCDFIPHTPLENPCTQCIHSDDKLQTDITTNTLLF